MCITFNLYILKNIKNMCKIDLSKSKKEIKGAHKKMQKLKTVGAVHTHTHTHTHTQHFYRTLLQNTKFIGENRKGNLIKIKEATSAFNCGIKIKQAMFV